MLNLIHRHLLNRIEWAKHSKVLDAMSTMEEFQKYVELTQPETFLFYQRASQGKRLEFQTIVNKLEISLKDKSMLDIGPAYGDTLDICHECGAKNIHFVEYEPFFYTYNRLKKFTKGYRINHLWKLRMLESSKYDLIWARGSIVADFFLKFSWLINIKDWLAQVEKIAAPGCNILICPHWGRVCSKNRIQDVYHNKFTEAMLQQGFTILSKIEHHNSESCPISFFKLVGALPG